MIERVRERERGRETKEYERLRKVKVDEENDKPNDI